MEENKFEKLEVWERDLNYIDNNTCVKLISELTEVGKMINGLINYLRSKIKNI